LGSFADDLAKPQQRFVVVEADLAGDGLAVDQNDLAGLPPSTPVTGI
jgi:hypothetical protein